MVASEILLLKGSECREDWTSNHHGCSISGGRRRFRHNRGAAWNANRIPAWYKHVIRSARWGAERRLYYLRVLDGRERERRERAAVKARRKKETARLEGYKASVAPFSAGCFLCIKKSPKMDDYHLKLPLVPRAGLEPARAIAHQILSLARLPIPPPRHKRTLQATV